MDKRIFYHNLLGYNVIFEENIINQMLELCREKMPLETGGILVGEYLENGTKASITIISGPPNDSKHGRRTFYRGINDLSNWLKELWKTKRKFYLGEWHFHPNSWPNPSHTDINQMKQISIDVRYRCPEPILFIIGGDPHGKWYASCHVFPRNKTLISLTDDSEL